MARYATPPGCPKQESKLTRLPSEVIQNILKALFEQASVDLKKPHDLNQQTLIESFPILTIHERFLSEGIHVLLRYAIFEIEDLTYFLPTTGAALRMLQMIRNLSLQHSQLATFGLSRQFPVGASRSSRQSFVNLQRIDINTCSRMSSMQLVNIPANKRVQRLVECAWERPEICEEIDLCHDYYENELAEFIRRFDKKYIVVVNVEYWVDARLRCEAAMSKGSVTEIVVENKGQWWNEDLWKEILTSSWACRVGKLR